MPVLIEGDKMNCFVVKLSGFLSFSYKVHSTQATLIKLTFNSKRLRTTAVEKQQVRGVLEKTDKYN